MEHYHHEPSIRWTPAFKLGIPILDEHHRGIVSLINALDFAVRRDENAEFFVNTIFNLADYYAKLHFATEESLMKYAGYPDLENHKKEHADMVKESFALATQSIRVRNPYIYLKFLHEWWINHIRTCDLPYGPFVRQHTAQDSTVTYTETGKHLWMDSCFA